MLLFLLAFGNHAVAGNNAIMSRIKAKVETRETRITDDELRRADPNQVLAMLAPYERHSEWLVRRTAFILMARVAAVHPADPIRQEVVARLTDSVFSGSGHNEGPLLMGFTASDFDDRSRNIIRQALARENVGILTVRLCGVANIQDQLPRLETLLIDPNMRHSSKWYFTLGWNARLARARMGVKEDIRRCIELAESEQDETERILRILPQIGYIRRPEAIEYLRRYLESSKRLPPTNPGMLGELYASRVMHIFAESLQGYPVEQRPAGNYTEQEIELCRRWMANRANWRIVR